MKCSKCGSQMKIRKGRYGEFWGCTAYPKCTHTEKIGAKGAHQAEGVKSAVEKKSQVVERVRIVWSISNFDTEAEARDYYNKMDRTDREVKVNHITGKDDFWQVEWKAKE